MTGANGFSVSGYGPQRSTWARLFARDSLARRLDWPILLSAIALSVIGAALVYSATRNRTELNQGDPYYFLVRHLLNPGIGFALMAGTVWLGHRTLRTAVPILYGISVLPAFPVQKVDPIELRNLVAFIQSLKTASDVPIPTQQYPAPVGAPTTPTQDQPAPAPAPKQNGGPKK